MFPAFAGKFFTSWATREVLFICLFIYLFITKIYFDKSALQPRSYLEFHIENWFHLNKRDELTFKKVHLDFPDSPVDGNPPANAWDMGSIPG